jgi:hypothetical protein
MPIPPLLALNAFDSLPIQVHELVGGTTPTQIGSDLGGAGLQVYVPGAGNKGNMQAHALTFKGERYCIVITTTLEVRRENEGGAGNWGAVYTFGAAGSLNEPTYGLKIVKDGGDIALVAYGCGIAAGTVRWAKSNTGQSGSWTETNVVSTARMGSTSVVFRNRIYWEDPISQTNPTRVHEIDPAAGTLTTYNTGWNGLGGAPWGAADLCVAFDRLWAVGPTLYGGGTGRWALYEFTGGGWTLNGNISGFNNSVDGNGMAAGKPCLWTDNTNLYCVVSTGINDAGAAQVGSTCYQGIPAGSSFTWSQDDTTAPTGLRPGARTAAPSREDRWSIYVDNDTDPANPDYYLIVAEGSAPGTGYAVYQWNGFGVEMGPAPGASVAIAFALPEIKHGGAEAISQGAATYAEIEDEAAIGGGYRLSYRIYGTGSGLTGRVYFSAEQGPPDTLATLVGGMTTFAAAMGDGGVTLHTVDIDLGLSGITPPDVSTWMIDLRP